MINRLSVIGPSRKWRHRRAISEMRRLTEINSSGCSPLPRGKTTKHQSARPKHDVAKWRRNRGETVLLVGISKQLTGETIELSRARLVVTVLFAKTAFRQPQPFPIGMRWREW
jgi:hypothetical protein